MAFVVPNEGEKEMLYRLLHGDTLFLRLFDTDITPAEGDTYSGYHEADGGGYAAIAMDPSSWTIQTGSGDTTYGTYPQQSFNFSGGDTIYGYYITTYSSAGDTINYFAERFTGAPYVIPSTGGIIKVTPQAKID